ncbi:uncharacterized protein LY89DRAFT_722521 [Mollisia scopiformis]|uniref:Uncharacterized protein n=1 Tax=Mollisia scopiformis TaxID=149040 RepID=A0A194WX44_MOLSC|nr:uncharacterized protein LY89DRAFT_722521 [Mollisia scopiformis]KUJ12157.1 hypothetical protein LY89DRAFT_722521 [Mollisia scopiformis]
MGCGPSRPPPENGFQLDDKRAVFRPPPSPSTPAPEMKKFFASATASRSSRRPEQAPAQYTSQNRAKEVARCAALLREMYTLDLEIWAMGNAHVEDVPERELKKRKANALFGEVRRCVEGWKGSKGAGWEGEEWRCVEDICEVVEQHGFKRY